MGAPALVTGGAGFFGSLLATRLCAEGRACVVLDLEDCTLSHPLLTAVKGDIRDKALLAKLFEDYRFETVFHCAAILAHAVKDKHFLWDSNVGGTEAVAEAAARSGARTLIFISSNCLWAQNMGRPVTEDDVPAPVEIYGRSKLEGERILERFRDRLDVVTIRCPTIIDEGRLGLLSILFEFINEGRRVWVLKDGRNRYQFIYAQDLIDACLRSERLGRSALFNIGSDDVTSFRETYQYVIDRAGTTARVASLPAGPAIAAMRAAHAMGLSPLGPYQYRMIAEDFEFDTSRIKRDLAWRPTLSNAQMLWRAYDFFQANRAEISARTNVSAHRQPARMGVIRVLKWVS